MRTLHDPDLASAQLPRLPVSHRSASYAGKQSPINIHVFSLAVAREDKMFSCFSLASFAA
jgi:hypothetical protein